ncbi:esterase-like activity of phytase family protein [Bdellovibrio sp. SKB1291214]|uniref:esterase-like activity of phytase family protein n=1 Tax=Bdellovibrio sp. SKB1291214 TaxID=1732569 RepID=UPI002240420A|nr:esterase-like activity of phytase family protein [Bdellovibrio sp. SKB1291214]UYL10033.1 esterase-like activity of phytase family protein [Bdellovibrio sp. SKB1291214]
MHKIWGSIVFALVIASQAQALTLKYIGETSIVTGAEFDGTTIGGLSGITYVDGILNAVSDDKGRYGEPRFYQFDFKADNKSISLIPKSVTYLKGLRKEGHRKAFMDAEGLVALPGGDFLISSEGNNDSKPRSMPRVLRVGADGKWKSDLTMPDKYLPERTGLQSKGVQNNGSLEGLSATRDGKFVFTCLEAPLTQDIDMETETDGVIVRILKFEDRGAQRGYFTPASEFAYRVAPYNDNQIGREVFKGVSEILALSDNKVIVLERGARLHGKGWKYTVSLYVADLTKATDTLSMVKLADHKYTLAEKTKLVDFETDLVKERGKKDIQNFEALTFGPTLPDGRRTLLVMSDNNFSKSEVTELLVFAIEGE